MAEFKSKDPNVSVVGGAILAFLKSLATPRIGEKYLAKHGIENVQEDGWYSQQSYFNAMKEFAEIIGMPALESIGGKIPDNAVMPEFKDLFEVIEQWTNVYMTNHRGDNTSYFKITDRSENHMVIETNNAYPCAFDRGLFRSVAKKFYPSAVIIEIGDKCRARGDDICQYKIDW